MYELTRARLYHRTVPNFTLLFPPQSTVCWLIMFQYSFQYSKNGFAFSSESSTWAKVYVKLGEQQSTQAAWRMGLCLFWFNFGAVKPFCEAGGSACDMTWPGPCSGQGCVSLYAGVKVV